MATSRAPLFPILLVNFIGTLGFSIVLPFLVFLVTRFGGNAVIYGLMGATYPLFQLFGAPILGRWSDRYGRQRILFLSQTGTLLAWVIFTVALFLPEDAWAEVDTALLGSFTVTLPLILLFLSRALDGLTGGNVSVANAYLADISTDDDRSRNFGRMGISSNLGFILGPALAGVLGATVWGETLPVLGALVISLVATVLIRWYLPESKPCLDAIPVEGAGVRRIFGQESRDCYEARALAGHTWRDVLRVRHVPFMLGLYFVIFLGFNFFYTSFPMHAANALAWSVTEIGTFFAVLSFMMVIVQGPVLARVSRLISSGWLVVGGNVILGASFLLLLSSSTLWIYVAAALFALGNGLMWPSVLAILARVGGTEYQGAVQGFASSAGSLASILGLIAGGLIYESAGDTTFVLSALSIFLAAILGIRLLGLERSSREERGGA